MEWLVFAVVGVAVVAFAIVAQRRGWIDLSSRNAKRRGGGGGMLTAVDEVFHPARHEAQLELDRQTVLPAPAPVPGDGDRGVYRGSVRIDVSESSDPRTPGGP